MTPSTAQAAGLQGMRVLVVEDSFLIAWSLRKMLNQIGCCVVGPASSVTQAQQLLEQEGCDAAILDINLGGETSLPIAEALAERRTPFFFVTGYSGPELAADVHQGRRRLRKPLTEDELRAAMLESFVA